MATAPEQKVRTPEGHFRTLFYAAVFRLLHRLRQITGADDDLDGLLERFPFLRGYLEEMRLHLPSGATWSESMTWWEAEEQAWEQSATDPHLPLRALLTEGGLDRAARTAFMLAGLVEEDSRFGNLFAHLQQPLGQRRPTAGLLERLAGEEGAWRRLLPTGLAEVVNPGAPRPEWELIVPSILWEAARGWTDLSAPWCRYRPPQNLQPVERLVLPPDLEEHLSNLPSVLTAGQARMAVLRGSAGSERLEAFGAVARAINRGLLEVESAQTAKERNALRIGPLSVLLRAIPMIRCDLGPGETYEVPALPGYSGPILVLMGDEGGLRGEAALSAVTLKLPPLDRTLRRRIWREAFRGHRVYGMDAITDQFLLPGGHIRQVAKMAAARAALEGHKSISLIDVRHASRALNRQSLDTLATRLEAEGAWKELALSSETRAKLEEMEQRCRHRESLQEQVQGRGVRALFSGPSGTGKTMAAKILAASLGMDIYRVDLAAVVNKYIGETEKNLHQVLSRAEELDVILLLDEGDALMARRTDVRSANDRYANLETNYLLQRLEHYQGIVIITTNAGDLIDQGFRRRLDVVVTFVPPGAPERLLIWKLHLPKDHQVPAPYLADVAARCALTGGQIKSAATHGALLAVDQGSAFTQQILADAILSEYRKAGALCPLTVRPGGAARQSGLDTFVQAMRDKR